MEQRTTADIMKQSKDGMIDGHCINCSCGMRNGRHQDFRKGLHDELCDCRNAQYVK